MLSNTYTCRDSISYTSLYFLIWTYSNYYISLLLNYNNILHYNFKRESFHTESKFIVVTMVPVCVTHTNTVTQFCDSRTDILYIPACTIQMRGCMPSCNWLYKSSTSSCYSPQENGAILSKSELSCGGLYLPLAGIKLQLAGKVLTRVVTNSV